MSRRGDVYANPVTGERAVVRNGSADPGARLVADLYIRPGGQVAGEHVHPRIIERFEVLSGRVAFTLSGEEQQAEAGTRVVVAPGVAHDWWNAGETEAHVRVELDGPGYDRFEQAILLGFGLAHEGKVNERGMPGLLQLAVMARAYDDVIRFTSPPRFVQRALFGVLAPLGRLLGRRASYPHHPGLVIRRLPAAELAQLRD